MRQRNRNSSTRQHSSSSVPRMLTSFVGRSGELGQIFNLLGSSRLVTLTGTAGCGKTRLAHHVATKLDEHLDAGVFWVKLARLSDPELVLPAVARAIGVREHTDRSLIDTLTETLGDSQPLLVLDNCEHLLDASARVAEALLVETEAVILATSREPLDVAGEVLYAVPPLSLPLPEQSHELLAKSEAAQLFVERARSKLPRFELTPGHADGVTQICRSLDGIPLAIELASAQITVLTVQQIAERLNESHGVLPLHDSASYSYHQTLQVAIDWSHDLLSDSERILFRRLSVFYGGATLASIESVCAGRRIDQEQVLGLLASLVRKSLVTADTLGHDEARYTLLEPLRQYARQKLEASGDTPEVHDRHLQRFVELAEETESKLSGPYQQLWLNWLERELDNIRAALAWAVESRQIEAGLRLAVALYGFWTIRDYADEALTWFERLLRGATNDLDFLIHARALAYATLLAGFRTRTDKQIEYGRRAEALAPMIGERNAPAMAWALAAGSQGARAAGNHRTEFELAKQAIEIHRRLGNTYYLGIALTTCSFTAMSVGDFETARAMLDEGIPIVREMNEPYRIAMALNFSGDLSRCEGDFRRARAEYEESMGLLRDLDAPRDIASVLHNLGHTNLHLGDRTRARELFVECLELQQSQRNTIGIVECLIGFAALAVAHGVPSAAARLLAAIDALDRRQTIATWAATRMEYERVLSSCREALTANEYEQQRWIGGGMSLEQAVDFALEVSRATSEVRSAQRQPDELTAREHEIATLIARGKSNEELANELSLSKRTVEKHISNIRAKLELSERTQIVRWVIDNQLDPDSTSHHASRQ